MDKYWIEIEEEGLQIEAFRDGEQIATFVQTAPCPVRIEFVGVDFDVSRGVYRDLEITSVTTAGQIDFHSDKGGMFYVRGTDMTIWYEGHEKRALEERVLARLEKEVPNPVIQPLRKAA
jgi:hypothetical protein